ncbi:hypothetical protein [Nocardioides cynanchi]|uniref:hypothetical protein n=1 Tax=Nocardioides cynanchi TaxID=2558918 RepID=UPI00124854EC|nr:hypothetical protein [Nocardioides cynanchi]
MSRTMKLVVGVLLILVGVVWTLQGLDVMGGSGMSGHAVWAVIGPVVALVGVVLVARSRRTPPAGAER